MENRDSFGLDASSYQRFRPTYPDELYDFLVPLCVETRAALDCATGNGQAAADLARRFDRVAAFDSSESQIAAAVQRDNIEYRVGSAEELPFPDEQFDLVTAAQAAHWFNLPRFYDQLRQAANPDAILAIWGYSYCRIEAAIDEIVDRELLRRIEPFWAEGNRVILEKYRSIDFPFEELRWPGFRSFNHWTRDGYMKYLRTWSAVKKFQVRYAFDPVEALETALEAIWPGGAVRAVEFEFVGRVGRVRPA
jgi:SAM-dependent methyltransferase